MLVIRIVTGPDGLSRFEDADLPLTEREYAPPTPPMGISAEIGASAMMLGHLPAGWCGDWHPSPCRQVYVQLTGEIEVGAGDGEVRRLRPGDVALVEDTTGPGHTTRVIGDTDATCAFVHLRD